MQHNENSDPLESTVAGHRAPASTDYLQVIVKRSRMIFRATLAAMVISLVYSLILPNTYTARTLILPTQEDKGLMSAMMAQMGGLANLAGGAGVSFGAPTAADLYITMLKSEAVRDPIIDRFRLLELYRKKYRADAYKSLDKNVAVTTGRRDGVITIRVDDRDPKRAAAMANAYVEELGVLAVRLNVSGAGQNREFIQDRLAKAKADLVKAEDNLRSFQAKSKTINMTAQAEATIKGVADLRVQLANQEVELATYRRRFADSSQAVKNLAASVANLRAQIAKLEGLNGGGAIPSVGSMPAIGQEYFRLMREFKVQESLVELLTKQFEMASFSQARDISPFQVIQNAKAPERKSKPARSKIVLFWTFAAFMTSIICAIVLENIEKMPDRNRVLWSEMIKQFSPWKKL